MMLPTPVVAPAVTSFDETPHRNVRCPPRLTFRRGASSYRGDAHHPKENMMLKNLMYVTVYVSDQDRALAFYTDTLGLEMRADNPTPWGRFLTVARRPTRPSRSFCGWAPLEGASTMGRSRAPCRVRSSSSPTIWPRSSRCSGHAASSSRNPSRRHIHSVSGSRHSIPTGTGSRSVSEAEAATAGRASDAGRGAALGAAPWRAQASGGFGGSEPDIQSGNVAIRTKRQPSVVRTTSKL